jgi:hypothetical protein
MEFDSCAHFNLHLDLRQFASASAEDDFGDLCHEEQPGSEGRINLTRACRLAGYFTSSADSANSATPVPELLCPEAIALKWRFPQGSATLQNF